MEIVTGYKGLPHITSNAMQAFNQCLVGQGNFVFEVGNSFAAQLLDANTVQVSSGEGMIQGVHFRIEPGEVETLNIANGTVGTVRIDLICARYTKNATTGIEDVSLIVLQGPEGTTYADYPELQRGNILEGDTPVDFPMFQINLDGITPRLTTLFGIAGSRSYVGMIIQSTTLDTEFKVKAQYGGETWIQHYGYFLLGARDGVTADNNIKDGGEDTHKLTAAEMPEHRHGTGLDGYGTLTGSAMVWQMSNTRGVYESGFNIIENAGGNQPHNNMPPYKQIYIWERTE